MELKIPPKYSQDITNAASFLKSHGCQSIYLFGSLVTGKIRQNSDIDLGVKGFPKGKYIELFTRLYFDFDNEIDLVNFDEDEDLYSLLKRSGEVVQIG